jgi:LysR family glycine cleavage system transcriptional activator
MSDRLPSLTALRAFEAAARHMSFARAADELFVTPAALSYQIKSLETDLGQPLFRRLNRAVELTEAGRVLAPGASDAFTTLATAWRNVQRLAQHDVLTVTAGPAFTSKWLAPRMYDFAQAHPEIELRFAAGLKLADFDRDEVDVAIRFGPRADDTLFSEQIMEECVTPMMTPQLAERIRTPADLKGATLIHDGSLRQFKNAPDWAMWCAAANVDIDTSHGPQFSQADHALDAAMAGAGIVLGRLTVAMRALEAGRLVAPFEIGFTTVSQLQFVCPKGHESRPHVAAFKAWVFSEFSGSSRFTQDRVLIAPEDQI